MSKTFCPIPWIGQAIRNNGDVRVCCHMNYVESKGICKTASGQPFNIAKHSLKDAYNADIIRETRVSIMKGEWNRNCQRCKDEEDAGMGSRRKYENENFKIDPEEFFKLTTEDGYYTGKIRHLDLRFGNLCNLACRMCGAADSHSWYEDHVSVFGTNWFNDTHGKVFLTRNDNGRLTTSDYDWIYSVAAEHQFKQIADTIEYVYLVGGEPLIIDSHHKFLEMCLDNGRAKEITLEYNTNMTNIPAKVLEMWKHFKLVRIGCSIDGIGNYQEYQRWPSKWNHINSNLEKLNDAIGKNGNISAWLAVTVTILNVTHIPDMLEWKLNNLSNFRNHKRILGTHMAFRPLYLSLRALPKEDKEFVKNLYAKKIQELSSKHPSRKEDIILLLDSIIKFMEQEQLPSKHFEEFIRVTNVLDKNRNQNVLSVCNFLRRHFN